MTEDKEKKDSSPEREIIKNVSMLSELGLMMISCILVGFFLGVVLDKKSGHSPVWTIVFLLIGILSGFWSVYKRVMRQYK